MASSQPSHADLAALEVRRPRTARRIKALLDFVLVLLLLSALPREAARHIGHPGAGFTYQAADKPKLALNR